MQLCTTQTHVAIGDITRIPCHYPRRTQRVPHLRKTVFNYPNQKKKMAIDKRYRSENKAESNYKGKKSETPNHNRSPGPD